MTEQQYIPTPSLIPQQLFSTLEEAVELSRQFLDLLKAEKTALIEMKINILITLSRKKQDSLARMQALDKAIHETTEEIGNRKGSQTIGLSALIPFASKEEAERLTLYRGTLLRLRQEILDRNHINKNFAQDTRGYLNDAISLITGTMANQPIYGNIGMNRPSANKPALISREV